MGLRNKFHWGFRGIFREERMRQLYPRIQDINRYALKAGGSLLFCFSYGHKYATVQYDPSRDAYTVNLKAGPGKQIEKTYVGRYEHLEEAVEEVISIIEERESGNESS